MNKLLLGSAAFFLLSAGAASATDMPMKAPAYKAVAPFSWSGLYVGAHAGYGWGDYKMLELESATGTSKQNPAGWLGGLQIGYNAQFAPHWMLGSEIDLSWADLNDTGTMTTGVATGVKVDYLSTARTRFGYVIDRTMFYATGGLAWAHVKASEVGVQSINQYHVGWTLGAGLEYALDPRWSVKLEYLYADLGKNSDFVSLERHQDLTLSTVRAGISYRFGEPTVTSANMPVKAYAARTDWTGSYIGLHGGYGRGDLDLTTVGLHGNPNPKGAFGGFQTGYNWQFAPTLLFGLETDTSFGGLKDDSVASAVLTFRGKIEDFGTVRARLGYIADRSLWYVTGGAAVAKVKTVDLIAGAPVDPFKLYHVGWTVGGGIEYKIDPMWSAKVEYLYADLGKNRETIAPALTDLTMGTVKVGLNYYGPVLERFLGGR